MADLFQKKPVGGAEEEPPPAGGASAGVRSYADRLIPSEFLTGLESARRARLVVNFCLLGSVFGVAYSVFYILIGHLAGALVILICSASFIISPALMRRLRTTDAAASCLLATFLAGFAALTFLEGGLQGHAIAWFVASPLCAFLFFGEKSAIRWTAAALVSAVIVAAINLSGVEFALAYDPKWNLPVTAAGYLGLIVFLSLLGLIFERGRTHASDRMHAAMADLARSNEHLLHLNQEKDEFLRIVAHDLKNPLTAITGNIQLARQGTGPEEMEKMLHNISEAAARMQGLITNLLDINMIERHGFHFTPAPCSVQEAVQQSLANNRVAANKKLIDLQFVVAAPLYVHADPSALLQILDNLVSNAVKFSLPRSGVYIHAMQDANRILVAVRDHGPGISETDQEKLFRKFTRLSTRPTGGESSSGLGLAIVKRLTEAMSGTIHCKSALGTGSTFTVSLPLAFPPATGSAAPEKIAPQYLKSPSPACNYRHHPILKPS
ncbi:MAG TPA: ATP-binding protein [Verrucomicrobiae bacterium]|nr:ATP-binding protein [Verrucomicrobiae bacterium]